MRTAAYHVDNASKDEIMAEYERILKGTCNLSRKFRDLICQRVERNKWDKEVKTPTKKK